MESSNIQQPSQDFSNLEITSTDPSKPPDFSFKTIISGDRHTGKTSLINFELLDKVDLLPTDNVLQYQYKNYDCLGKIIRLQIWDLIGDEAFDVVMKNFYRLSTCVFIVFSFDNKESFNNVEKWINKIENGEDLPLIVLVGNKSDLSEKERKIKKEEVDEVCRNLGIDVYYETSSLNGNGIHDLFKEVVRQLVCKYLEKILNEGIDNGEDSNIQSNNHKRGSRNYSNYQKPRLIESNGPCERCVCNCQ